MTAFPHGEKLFKKILIANRGEIALRIIYACRELGIATVAIYSEADRDSLHVRFADEEVCVGPPRSSQSYLSVPNVISAAEITGADAIHPGYGFLSENAHFAEVCEACDIRFIGPGPDVLRVMGDKAVARETVARASVPVIPGSAGTVADEATAVEVARSIGFPVILKAAAGGGGKGMRVVSRDEDIPGAFELARGEAHAAFGNGALYIERYIESPRHIEVQVLGDGHGRLVHLGERECSIQRRHQKLVEESPSSALGPELRERICQSALAAARAASYVNAGTVEFLLAPDGSHYFIEMNTRIQVEHPVTEMVTGIDLVKQQIRIAAGRPLSFSQGDVVARGHAIECRINAEDPDTFAPSPGKITGLHWPKGPGIRLDTAAHAECRISPFYDSLVGKIVAHGSDRHEAIARMRRALSCTVIEGIKTTVPILRRILDEPDFAAGRLSTAFLDRFADRVPVR
ncbi:MAG: acetyl-CoA carboxylase biotin carboxylase subunit [Acidobacteriota bacterium]